MSAYKLAGRYEKKIVVGFTENHGMCSEQIDFPPEGVEYRILSHTRFGSFIFNSPIKGYMSKFDTTNIDIVESIIGPVITDKPWICSLAVYQEALAFNFFGLPSPKFIRQAFMRTLFLKKNCKKIIFWSKAGARTLTSYGRIESGLLYDKAVVVYPAIRNIDDSLIQNNNDNKQVNILFSGDFFRKGGANVIDAFEFAQKKHSNINLRICCDESIDFNTNNTAMRNEYLSKIHSNPNIVFGRVKREKMIYDILPRTNIYLLPSYQEAFGFAILEAMAFGIPVISINHMAIPEIIEDRESGFLIDVSRYDLDSMFKGYVVNEIPEDFKQYITRHLTDYLIQLIESPSLRKKMGCASVEIARSKFSFSKRNKMMKQIYEEAIS
jgi:glycosyltransferase involved in cell wall biosynthesis